ncbi:chemotaxis protein CheW [Shewanella gelidii]|uniref:Chemotaxis protein CheW n=1 Tax=Shewanella gelidii TaxID=1642821 RepID=A0A917JGT1_9GAMM|nr:chemotaxis protein CheW [Shewanella gelidii]MCL1096441.1 chemotaxis protein CheW [Shewanella gelidii]GGI67415.1 chemotaxis protein CheW [Shewanella gelidii]
MSKSVDQTVFDYFSLLLTEEDSQPKASAASLAVAASANTAIEHVIAAEAMPAIMPKVEQKTDYKVNKPAPQFAEPSAKLDKQSLESLLASVSTAEVAKPTIENQVETRTKNQTENRFKTKPKIKEQLKEQAKVQTQAKVKENEAEKQVVEKVVADDVEVAAQVQEGAAPPSITKDLQQQLDDEFQVLFFKVAGLTLAVPLVSLGGIVKVEHINQIFGRPDWFLGVQSHRDSQLNLVDTCAWVMPDKYDEALAESVDYQYFVVLEDSNWGLACESLVHTVKINKSQVNWRGKAGKRPWLAGVVKEQMCGILNVQSLIEMLNAGLGCQDPID